jgi:hypothetical protein
MMIVSDVTTCSITYTRHSDHSNISIINATDPENLFLSQCTHSVVKARYFNESTKFYPAL